ncbi:MAG: bifunctional oligoribonuclease/PAP phosphatase NrnA [Firmicutes bacterium]|nr:bifunctional oligoribonuclease/PAP phosphatase NrnA [Bacillota bacterium]
MNTPSWERVISILKKYNRFTLGCHLYPDGDAIGSLLALGLALAKAGKEVEMVLPEGIPLTFDFLPGIHQTVIYPSFQPEVVLSLDCAERARLQLPEELFDHDPVLVNIDHHISNDGFGHVNLILPEAAATGQIVFQLLRKSGFAMDAAIASALYTAIATDTGFFRYANTTGEVLSIAAKLVEEYQISPSFIAERVYEEKSFASIRLLAEVLSTLQVSENQRYSWMYLNQEMIRKYEVEMEEIDNYVNYTSSIRGIEVGLFFKETKPDVVKISWRSKAGVDVSRLAAHFGGGGHTRAAGCLVQGPLPAVMTEVLTFLHHYFEENMQERTDLMV